nr:MAG TPA: helix-turn-helix protein [Caudoviricetes sp.]
MAKTYVNDAVVINLSTYEAVQSLSKKSRLAFYDAYILSGLMDETIYSGIPLVDSYVTLLRPTQVATAKRHAAAVKNGRKGGENNPHDEKFTIEEILAVKGKGYTNRQIAEALGCSYSTVQKKIKEHNDSLDGFDIHYADTDADETEQDVDKPDLPF